MIFVIVTGSFTDGFSLIGPFASDILANEYIIKHQSEIKGDWWVLPVSRPKSRS